jgi:hypothetical protein
VKEAGSEEHLLTYYVQGEKVAKLLAEERKRAPGTHEVGVFREMGGRGTLQRDGSLFLLSPHLTRQ